MSDEAPLDEHVWEAGWDGHSLAQLRRLARLSLGEKLQWLEEAQRLANALARDARSRAPGTPPPPAAAGAPND